MLAVILLVGIVVNNAILLVSMVLTLFVVPALYLIASGAADRLTTWLTGAPHAEPEPVPAAAGRRVGAREVVEVG